MANIVLAWPNRVDEATLSGGAWQPTLPLANLQTRELFEVARSLDLDPGSTQLTLTLPAARNIGLIALVAHNLSLSAAVRVEAGYGDDLVQTQYDSGWQPAWPAVVPYSQAEWENDNWWSGQLDQAQRDAVAKVFFVRPNAIAKTWRIAIDDPANPEGFVQLGRAFLAESWSPRFNYAYGNQFGYEADVTVARASGGNEYLRARPSRRIFAFSLDCLVDAEAHARVFDLQRDLGEAGELFVLPNPDDVDNAHRRAFLARLKKINPITHRNLPMHAAAFSLVEIL
jgi:hypothetical protein